MILVKRLYNILLIISAILILFEVIYLFNLLRLFDDYCKVKDSDAVFPVSDLWLSQHAYISPLTKKKLRENTCTIRTLNPFDRTILNFFKPMRMDCKNYNKTFYFKSNVHEDRPEIIMLKALPKELKCCYEHLRFNKSEGYKPVTLKTDRCTFIKDNRTKISTNSQYILIHCWDPETLKLNNVTSSIASLEVPKAIYAPKHHEILFFVPKPEQDVVKRSEEKRRQSKTLNSSHPPLNVIILGFDEVSRLNFIRLMGKTFEYLRKDLDAIDLQGFNKIGDATLNNTLAFMANLDFGGVLKTCWNPNEQTYDDCPWIWKNFSEKGYITVSADDYNSVFDYRFNGFKKQPTDYYFQPFARWYHRVTTKRWEKLGTYDCIGNERAVDLLNDQAVKIAGALRDHPFFQFHWMSRVHENPGYPSLIDKSTLKTLMYYNESGILNKSIIIMLSDHGWRAGDIMLNAQARLENKMSFAFIILPKWFRNIYAKAYENLVENQYRLTTPYDIYSTMIDILSPNMKLADWTLEERTDSKEIFGKSISLFLPVPKNRTCEMASVDAVWCACGDYKKLSPDSLAAQKLGRIAVDTINSWLAPFPKCYKYSLHKLISVEVRKTLDHGEDSTSIDFSKNQTFRIVFMVVPKWAQFEAVIFNSVRGDNVTTRMSTELFRLNKYQNSRCMDVYSLKKICACK